MAADDAAGASGFDHLLRRDLLEMSRGTPLLSTDEIGLFEWHLHETEGVIARMEEAAQAYIRKQVEAGREDIDDGGMVPVAYHVKRVRYASVIFLASSLESFLKRACDTLRQIVGEQNARFSADELAGKPWDRRRKFLETYGGFELPVEPWATLRRLCEVRNRLVHDNGEVEAFTAEQKKKADDFVRDLQGVSLSSGEIVIEVEFLRNGLKAFKELAEFVEAQLRAVTDRALRPRTVR